LPKPLSHYVNDRDAWISLPIENKTPKCISSPDRTRYSDTGLGNFHEGAFAVGRRWEERRCKCQDPLAHYWRTSEGILSSTHSRNLRPTAATTTPTPNPLSPFNHRQPQSCLTTEKSRSRTLPALPSFPRRSPTSKAASSCSTRQAHRKVSVSAQI